MMREIAKEIVNNSKDKEFLNIDSTNGVEWLRDNCIAAHVLLEKFLQRHGHRALKEFDLSAKTWAMQPDKVIDMIKSNLSISTSDLTPRRQMTVDDILDQLKTPLGDRAKSFMRRVIPQYHKGVQLREEAKSRLIETIHEVRRVVIYLGEKMVNEGFLPQKDLIFHLNLYEIQLILKTRNSRLINIAIRRQKVFPQLDELKFEEIMFGIPRPLSEQNRPDEIGDSDILAKG